MPRLFLAREERRKAAAVTSSLQKGGNWWNWPGRFSQKWIDGTFINLNFKMRHFKLLSVCFFVFYDVLWWANEHRMCIFPTKWRAKERQGGGLSTPFGRHRSPQRGEQNLCWNRGRVNCGVLRVSNGWSCDLAGSWRSSPTGSAPPAGGDDPDEGQYPWCWLGAWEIPLMDNAKKWVLRNTWDLKGFSASL